jgi:hypothetical protein
MATTKKPTRSSPWVVKPVFSTYSKSLTGPERYQEALDSYNSYEKAYYAELDEWYADNPSEKPANYKNPYVATKSTYQTLIDEYQTAYDEAKKSNEDRYQQSLDLVENAGVSTKADIAKNYAANQGNIYSNLTSRGLTGTTILPTMIQGNTEAQTADTLKAQESINAQKLGVVQGRVDTYPESILSLIQALGGATTSAGKVSQPKSTQPATATSAANPYSYYGAMATTPATSGSVATKSAAAAKTTGYGSDAWDSDMQWFYDNVPTKAQEAAASYTYSPTQFASAGLQNLYSYTANTNPYAYLYGGSGY